MKKQFAWQTWFLLAFLFFGISACGGGKKADQTSEQKTENAVGETKNDQAEQPEPAKKEEVVEGGALNSYFPKSGGDFDIIFTQEKDGFVQAVLKEKNEQVATFSVSDVANNPSAASKYDKATEKVLEYPSMERATGKFTQILVGKKYQVSVQSDQETFTKEKRIEWLKKFNLKGLESLKK